MMKKIVKNLGARSIFLIVLVAAAFPNFIEQAKAFSSVTFRLVEIPDTTDLKADFAVRVLIDSAEPLNAYRAILRYPQNTIALTSINVNHSVVNVWQSQNLPSSGGRIELLGGSSEPWSGSGGELATLNFRRTNTQSASVNFELASAFLANGEGTQIAPLTKDLVISAGSQAAAAGTAKESSRPSISGIRLEQDPFNDDNRLLIFAAEDPDSGISFATISTKSWLYWSDPQEAANPHPIASDVWAVKIRVYDNAGNFDEKTFYFWNALFVRGLILVILICSGGLFMLISKRRREGGKPI